MDSGNATSLARIATRICPTFFPSRPESRKIMSKAAKSVQCESRPSSFFLSLSVSVHSNRPTHSATLYSAPPGIIIPSSSFRQLILLLLLLLSPHRRPKGEPRRARARDTRVRPDPGKQALAICLLTRLPPIHSRGLIHCQTQGASW